MIDDSHLHVETGGPEKPRQSFSIKRVFGLLFGVIGIIASTGAVVGMVQGWFNP